MTQFDYGRIQAKASGLFKRFRQGAVTLTRTPTTPGANPWDPPTPGTPVVYTLDAVVRAVEDKFVDGTTVYATDRQVMCGVLPVEIMPGDTLAIDGKAVTIVKTMRIPAAGVAVAWRFIVRG
jgi:hypothetical protein